jgi:hypothetical protein
MDESVIISRIESVPQISRAIVDFFRFASAKNRKAYILAIQNSCVIPGVEKYYQDSITNMMTQSYAEYYGHFKKYECNNPNIVVMNQMLLYSLFWENAAVLRLLDTLAQIIEKGEFIAPVFSDSTHETSNRLRQIIRISRENGLLIGGVIESLYYRQIRNATVHAQLFFFDNFIRLENYDKGKSDSFPLIKLDTWNKIYFKTCEFIDSLFYARRIEISRI